MEAVGFISQFREILPKFIVYLVVPFYLGLQLSFLAKDERKANKEASVGSFALDFIGLFFAVGVPVFFIISTLAILKLGDKYPEFMAAVFRYGLMFFFFGMWSQFFGIMAIRSYRDRDREGGKLKYALFYALSSVFITLTAFWGADTLLIVMSLGFLAVVSPVLLLPYRKMSLAFLGTSLLALLLQTAGFIYVSSMA